ncbi:hypothetical protein DPX16_18992 [Anabarilius grahami]|uniref:Uncharacterized protein n=1 Tax=Anabarilius grahami TaxID=495550 RepID=A0A3N0YM02_ANAGA|nr:hypothetical protein DPX16_18992 [Anabarilius grahami]
MLNHCRRMRESRLAGRPVSCIGSSPHWKRTARILLIETLITVAETGFHKEPLVDTVHREWSLAAPAGKRNTEFSQFHDLQRSNPAGMLDQPTSGIISCGTASLILPRLSSHPTCS